VGCRDVSAPDGYPRIVESPTLQAAEKGDRVTMPCVAVGSPQPNISWVKDFVPISHTDSRITILSSGKKDSAVSRPVSQSVSQSVSPSVSQSVNRWACE